MEALEISAKNVEDATKKALEQLGVGQDEVEITVLSEGKSGILGIGGEEARIRVTLKKPAQAAAADVAREVLETLLAKMGITARVETAELGFDGEAEGEQHSVAFDIRGEDLGILIGRRGQALAGLQYIVRLITSQKTGTWIPVDVDVESYKQRRYEALRSLALQIAERVKSKGTPFKFEPMPPNERRIIHMTLANDPDVTTESIGEGEERKVTVFPKGNQKKR